MADVELEPKKKTEKLEWPRVVLASGFLLVIAALGIGAGSEGSVLAKYVALGGLGLVGLGVAALAFSHIASWVRNGGQREPAR
jgi:hypothetical protein